MIHKVTHTQLIEKMQSIVKGKLTFPDDVKFRKSQISCTNVVTMTFRKSWNDFLRAFELISEYMDCSKTNVVSEKSPMRITVSEYGYEKKHEYVVYKIAGLFGVNTKSIAQKDNLEVVFRGTMEECSAEFAKLTECVSLNRKEEASQTIKPLELKFPTDEEIKVFLFGKYFKHESMKAPFTYSNQERLEEARALLRFFLKGEKNEEQI